MSPGWQPLFSRTVSPEVDTASPRSHPASLRHISKTLIIQCTPGDGGGHQTLENGDRKPGLSGGRGEGERRHGGPLWPFLTRCPCSCNLTCPPGLHGVDCAQACSCHEDSCDPVTGACRLGEWSRGHRVEEDAEGAGARPDPDAFPQRPTSARA